jgi:hypothetical protein
MKWLNKTIVLIFGYFLWVGPSGPQDSYGGLINQLFTKEEIIKGQHEEINERTEVKLSVVIKDEDVHGENRNRCKF